MSDHLAKRQRTTGSFSPASPPYHLAKPGDQTKAPAPIVHPNTPTSPPYPSMSSHSNGRFATTAVAPHSEMTPPSSVIMSQQTSQLSASATNPLPFPTPASTTAAAFSSNVDSDGDAMMADDGDDDALRSGEHRHSNHNRQGKALVPAADGVSGKALFKFRKAHHEESKPSAASEPHEESKPHEEPKKPKGRRPHGSQNLIELFQLGRLASSVARTDPHTGEKINKLRKSYEGHIKAMQIAGKHKAVKMDGAFSELMKPIDVDYKIQRVANREIENAFNGQGGTGGLNQEWDGLLTKGLAGMISGPLPVQEASRYRAYLGTDEVPKPKVGTEGLQNRALPPRSNTPQPGKPSLSRVQRQGAKRSYDESTYPGYSEGYADDTFADSTGGEDNGQGGMKKRRLAFERTSHQVEVGGARR